MDLKTDMSNIGYARVSTKKQGSSLDNQIKNLKKHGCEKIYSEAVSGACQETRLLLHPVDSITAPLHTKKYTPKLMFYQ